MTGFVRQTVQSDLGYMAPIISFPYHIHVYEREREDLQDIATYNEMVAKRLLSSTTDTWSQKLPEAVSGLVKLKIFMGGHAPRPP